MVSQLPVRRQLLAQNQQNNTPATMQGPSASPSIAGFSQPTLPNYGHTSDMQNLPGISHSFVNNSLAQGAATDIYGTAQRQMQFQSQPGLNVIDWQEEAYQKIQVIKEAYFAELHEFHQKISHKLQQLDTMPNANQSESYEKLKRFKVMLDRMIAFLHVPKRSITLVLKEKLCLYEKQIVSMLPSNRRQKEVPLQQQGQQQVQQHGQQQVQQQGQLQVQRQVQQQGQQQVLQQGQQQVLQQGQQQVRKQGKQQVRQQGQQQVRQQVQQQGQQLPQQQLHQQQKQQSTGSPFVDYSPSTPIAPSPLPWNSEKLASAAVSHQSAVQTTHQLATSGPPQTQAISVATPGISASPLPAELTSQEGNLPISTIMSRTSASERPVERIIAAIQSLSPKSLRCAVNDMISVVRMIDRIPHPAPGNGSMAAVGEDLVAMTKCGLQGRNFMSQDGGAAVKKMKRKYEIESMETTRVKRQKLEDNHALKEEIREINQKLIDTVVSICDEDSDSVAALSEGVEGIIVKCSYTDVAFSPGFKAKFASMQSPIAPLRLLVPADYPKSSPRPLDQLPLETGNEIEDLSFKARSRFSISIQSLSQPISLGEMARKWGACARKVIVEYAQQMGGGTFSSTYGGWEYCVSA